MPLHEHNTAQLGRFDFGRADTDETQAGTIKELLAEINQENPPSADGALVTIQSLRTVLKGIDRITGRRIEESEIKRIPLCELKTIKRLYRTSGENRIQLFNLIEPPHLSDKPSLEFRDTYPAPRNEIGAGVVAHLLSHLRREISDDRLAEIERVVGSLPEKLLAIEEQDTTISRTLSLRFPDDPGAKAAAYRGLAESIDAYSPHHRQTTNPLHEAVYTYLRTLRFAHFAKGFEESIGLAAIHDEIIPIDDALNALCLSIGESLGTRILSTSPTTSISELPTFVETWTSELIRLVERATGLKTERRNLPSIVELASRLLNLYGYFYCGERNLESNLVSPLDCVAALCTIRHEQALKTEHRPFWHAQESQGKNVIRHLQANRSLESIFDEDYVPHVINQIMYHRFCNMQSALIGQQSLHAARTSFRVARINKYAQCLRSNDIDVITKSVATFGIDCLTMAARCEIQSDRTTPSFFDKVDRWLSRTE